MLSEYAKSGKPGKVAQLSMIAGGIGFTPMYQIIQMCLACCNVESMPRAASLARWRS